MDTLYNVNGGATAYLADDNTDIYLYDGSPVAYLIAEHVYSFDGTNLGWINNGWYYDRSGHPAFFIEGAKGGPVRAAKQTKPVKGVRGVRPVKDVREARPARPVCSVDWSPISNSGYFNQRANDL
jgi:hypothetical protein